MSIPSGPLSAVQSWLYDNLPVCVAIFNRDRRYVYANAAYAATQGRTPRDLTGRPLDEIHGEWPALVARMIRHAHEIGRAVDEFNITLPYPRQPSLQCTWDVTVLPLRNDGIAEGAVLYMLDVTDRQALTYLSASEMRLRSVLDATIEAILVIDETGMILTANPATYRLFGYEDEELVGQPVITIMPSPFHEEHGRFLQRYLNTGVPHIIGTIREVQGRRKDGTIFPCELSVSESHELTRQRHFVGIIRDITERKQLQIELETERARLASIFDTVPLPLYVVEPDGRLSLYNEAARNFFGPENLPDHFDRIKRLHPNTRTPWESRDWLVTRAAREGVVIRDVEQIIVFPDGREVPVLVHAAPVTVEGTIIAAVGVLQDLTQLKASDRAKDAFLALISHELRTPLATIISWTAIALEDETLREEALRIVRRNADALHRIVNDLLDVSRVLYGKLELRRETVDAWVVACHIAEGMRGMFDARKQTLTLSPPKESLPVLADPVRLEQVITNLLVNAGKFTPEGGAISLEGARDGACARLRVRDNGMGISTDALPHVFERFQQIGRERVSGGLGLGLALVKGLVELHGGHVTVESASERQGSTFTVWLPLQE